MFPSNFLLFKCMCTHNAQKIKLGIPLRPAMGKEIQERLFSSLLANHVMKVSVVLRWLVSQAQLIYFCYIMNNSDNGVL